METSEKYGKAKRLVSESANILGILTQLCKIVRHEVGDPSPDLIASLARAERKIWYIKIGEEEE